MDEKFVLTTVAERENGEMLGRVPGNLNSLFADAVEAGHLEIMRAPDATTVLGHRITDTGRAYLAGEAAEPAPQPEPTPAPSPEPMPALAPATTEPAPAATTTTETPAQG
jgi:hypothetical protein